MTRYEYKVSPAPTKGRKGKGLKTPESRFAHALEIEINLLATEGWEYQRCDILPSEERQGLTSSHIVYRTIMVFRRPLDHGIPPLERWPTEPQADETSSTDGAKPDSQSPAADPKDDAAQDTKDKPQP